MKNKTEYLDVCTVCHFVWFDFGEYEALPRLQAEKPEWMNLSVQERERMALAKLEVLKQRQKKDQVGMAGPDNWWEIILAFLGPVEYNSNPLKHKPVITWSLAAVMVLMFVMTFDNLRSVVMNFGLIPAEFTRYFGFTLISSFFLHGGLSHLGANLYFLLVFGDNTEDILGKLNYIILIAIAATVGGFAHILCDPSSTTPCVGASGGISGILAYYCLRFPTAQVGMIIYFRWFRLPVGIMFVLWIGLQILLAHMQRAGVSNVSAFAHLGGAAVGIVFWLITRRSYMQAPALA